MSTFAIRKYKLLVADINDVYFQWLTVKAEKSSSKLKRALPSRSDQIKCLQSEQYDVLIVGGGATGSGCALDAATRGQYAIFFIHTTLSSPLNA